MKQNLLLLFAVAALGSVNSGCHTGGPYAPVNTNKYNYETTATFVDMDPGTQRSVSCSGIQRRTLPDGRMEVAANVLNLENRRLQVQISCVFKDEQGFEVDSTPWQTLILTENETKTERFPSANAQAKNFTIRIRQAR
jgi:hypothetical protein